MCSIALFAVPETAIIDWTLLSHECRRYFLNCYVKDYRLESYQLSYLRKDVCLDMFRKSKPIIPLSPPPKHLYFTLKEFMTNTYGFMRLYQQMFNIDFLFWEEFLLSLVETNPDIPRIELHFYSYLAKIPFVFVVDIKEKKAYIYTYSETNTIIHFSTQNRRWFRRTLEPYLDDKIVFDKKKYSRRWSSIPINTIESFSDITRPFIAKKTKLAMEALKVLER